MNVPRMKGALDGIADGVKQYDRSLTSHHPLPVSLVQSCNEATYQEHIDSILFPLILEIVDISPAYTFCRIAQ
jgi:hypothetical protein